MHKKWLFLPLLVLYWGCGSHRPVQSSSGVSVLPTTISVPSQQPSSTPSSVVLTPEQQWKLDIQQSLDSLCNSSLTETTQVGLYVYDLTAGGSLYEHNIRQRMRPASCQKVITAVSALHFLGGDYQFKTQLYITGNVSNNTLTGDVYIVGGMDPMLDDSNVLQLATTLKNNGISRINGHVYMDCSMKDDKEYGWGWCWDDDYGPMTALMVNAKASFATSWTAAVAKTGLRISSPKLSLKTCEPTATLLTTLSHSIDQVLQPMLKKSDNIYAESMFYNLAANVQPKGASRKEGAQRVNELLAALNLNTADYVIADGSGLSLYDYVTPQLFVTLLNYAMSQEQLRMHLLEALPIAGVDGTLSKRMLGTPAAGNVRAKTGSVTGISSLCGYLTAANGHVLSFSIINQGVRSTSEGRAFQDEVCIRLCQ